MSKFFSFSHVEDDSYVNIFWATVGTLGTIGGLALVAVASF